MLQRTSQQHRPSIAPKRRRQHHINYSTRAGRKVKELVATYTARLGEQAGNPVIAADIQRLAEIEALCWQQRAAAFKQPSLTGEFLLGLNRLENTSNRLKQRLGLVGLPPEQPEPVPDHPEPEPDIPLTLREILA